MNFYELTLEPFIKRRAEPTRGGNSNELYAMRFERNLSEGFKKIVTV